MTYISAALRQQVIQRAGNCCEYCQLSQDDNFLPFEIDHIIAEKHSGGTESTNLCLSCSACNGFKGSDIGSIDPVTNALTALYNPRTQRWTEHFLLQGATIEALTAQGRVTVALLKFNSEERVAERTGLLALGRYPCNTASGA
jgi:hypothetical protein